jgi:hypothetical protein
VALAAAASSNVVLRPVRVFWYTSARKNKGERIPLIGFRVNAFKFWVSVVPVLWCNFDVMVNTIELEYLVMEKNM